MASATMGKSLSISMVVAALLVTSVSIAAQQGSGVPPVSTGTAPSASASAADIFRLYDEGLDAVVAKVLPAVVRVEVSGFGQPEGSSRRRNSNVIARQRVLGSGVIVDPDGYIMTNAHVVVGAQRVQVTITPTATNISAVGSNLNSQQRVYDAKIVGSDRPLDLALLKIEEKGLPFIPLREQYSLQLGQTVLAIGSPEGLDHTVTRGIVSAVERQVDPDQPTVHVQTDAPINPGSSGGALIDREGNLIGLNAFTISDDEGSAGLGFAIPEPVIRFAYREFRDHGRLRRSTIGAHAQTITPDFAAGLKLPRNYGVVISDVMLGGPADKAGIKPRDVIIKVDDRSIDSLPKFSTALFLHNPDRPFEVEIMRGSDLLKLTVVPAATKGIDIMAEGSGHMVDRVDPVNDVVSPMGIFVLEVADKIGQGLPEIRSTYGLVVAAKVDYTPKLDADLEVGDVIRSINRVTLNHAEDLRAELARYRPGDPIVLEIEHNRVFQFIAFEME
jgi:serine protease Do